MRKNILGKIYVTVVLVLAIAAADIEKAEASFAIGALRGSERFDETVRGDSPWFYEHGEFSMQGINQFGYTGTCGEAALANALNHIFSTSYYTENMLVKMAVDHKLCTTESDIKENLGGMSPEQMMYLITFINNVAGPDVLEYTATYCGILTGV